MWCSDDVVAEVTGGFGEEKKLMIFWTAAPDSVILTNGAIWRVAACEVRLRPRPVLKWVTNISFPRIEVFI